MQMSLEKVINILYRMIFFNKELIIINTLNFEMHNQNLTEFLLFSFVTEYRRHIKNNDN